MIYIVICLALGIIGHLIGRGKNRPLAGFFLGACLGLIGIAILCLVPAKPSAEEMGRGTGNNEGAHR